MAADDLVIVDLPEFGDLAEWEECLAELKDMPQTPEVLEAIERCGIEIAELKGIPPPSMGDRWKDNDFVVIEDA